MHTVLAHTSAGTVRGAVLGDVHRFQGIPYAAAPVGAFRFLAPQPHRGWSGERDALRPGATPLMPPSSLTSSIPEPTHPGEEILNLDITAPARSDGPAPVYVWIHGGSYVAGTTSGGWFDGVRLARSGIVVVAISYRLGFDGFGLLPGAPDNRGVLDCIAALEWVRDNIAAFGGDPNRVTLGGQSAGGGLTLALLAAPAARGLFRSAIVHSAPLPDIVLADASDVAEELAANLEIDNSLAGWRSVSRGQIVAAERALDDADLWSSLAQLHTAISRRGPLTRFGPIVDTSLVPDVLAALAQPDDRPLMLGTTAAEFNPMTAQLDRPLGGVSPVPVLRAVGLPAALARAYPRAYPDRGAAQLLGQALTDRAFRMTAVQVAQARATAGCPAALWDFRWHPEHGPARHCIDLPFAWDVLDGDRVDRIAGDAPPTRLADEFTADIAHFITTANATWPTFAVEHPVAKVYDDPCWIGRDPYRFERIALTTL